MEMIFRKCNFGRNAGLKCSEQNLMRKIMVINEVLPLFSRWIVLILETGNISENRVEFVIATALEYLNFFGVLSYYFLSRFL